MTRRTSILGFLLGLLLVAAVGNVAIGDFLFAPKGPLNPSQQKAIKSYHARILEHQAKLDAYRKNPDAFDNQGLLKNAPNAAVRQKIIEGRIRHLENEIKAFQDNIRKIENGG